MLLEYALGDERSFLWAVTPTSIKSFELPQRVEIEAAARRVYELVSTSNLGADKEEAEAMATLSQMLLGPVAEQLGKKRLLMVSDGALQYIPFGALPAPKASVVRGQLSVAKSETIDFKKTFLPRIAPLRTDSRLFL